ncbi:uncharacterized protein LOC131849952 [Achroia grisella]|uniref:uncharacterized protein LOC131849952 n=1 Tax=Achroia grisella TaxID=688607 RepID=UPI0027D23723|nr:uncharacterized protein LOC131849952 [Achroia grisella]
MYFKHFLTLCVLFINVNCECDNYFKCLGNFINNFFGSINNTTHSDENLKNFTYYEVKDVNGSEFHKIVSDISSLIKGDSDKTDQSVLSRSYNNNKTHILLKLFEYDESPKGFEGRTDTTTDITNNAELVQEISINVNNSTTEDIITDVNNMVDSLDNLEDNEVSLDDSYFGIDDDNNTDYPNIDYVELYKDATIEYTVLNVTESPKTNDVIENEKDFNNIIDYSINNLNEDSSAIDNDQMYPICQGNITQGVYPWIATIFIKNTTLDNQFEYFCDGAVLSERTILTAGRCVTTNPTKTTIDPEDLIVILGKKSLHSVSGNEKVYKIKSIILHENYIIKDGVVENDLAILVLREPADFNKDVGAACMFGEQDIIIDYQQTGTTAWSLSGDLTPIYFDKEKSRACNQENKVENTFCATYGDDVALCPSYGGLHATKHTDNKWYLHGIRTGDPTARRICVERDIKYTALINFIDWIVENIQNNKN